MSVVERVRNWVPDVKVADLEPWETSYPGYYTVGSAVSPTQEYVSIASNTQSSWKAPTDDTSSFKRIKENGIIKMTDYRHGGTSYEHTLLYLPMVRFSSVWRHRDDGSIWAVAPVISCGEYDYGYTLADLEAYLGTLPVYTLNTLDSSLVGEAIQDVKSTVVSRSYQTLDALTALAESKDTLLLLKGALQRVRHPIRSFRNELRHLSRNKLDFSKRVADLWLKYRYAIMPEVYQAQDIIKLLEERRFIFSTERTGRVITPKPTGEVPQSTGWWIEDDIQGSVSIKAIGKAKFGTSLNRMSGLISFNPAQTAWELIPYSFVVDWFINVGDWIASQSLALLDVAKQRKFCYSIRTQLTTTRTCRISMRWKYNRTFDATHKIVDYFSPRYERDSVFYKSVHNTYERVVFSPSEVSLMFNPSLSTERWLDTFALSLNSIVRSLKA